MLVLGKHFIAFVDNKQPFGLANSPINAEQCKFCRFFLANPIIPKNESKDKYSIQSDRSWHNKTQRNANQTDLLIFQKFMSFISHTNLLIQTMKCVHKKWFSMIHVKRDLKRFGNVFFFIVVVVSFRANKRSLSKRSVGNYKCVCYLISVNLLTMFVLLSLITKSVKIQKFIAIFGSKIDTARKTRHNQHTVVHCFFLSMSSCSFLRLFINFDRVIMSD